MMERKNSGGSIRLVPEERERNLIEERGRSGESVRCPVSKAHEKLIIQIIEHHPYHLFSYRYLEESYVNYH